MQKTGRLQIINWILKFCERVDKLKLILNDLIITKKIICFTWYFSFIFILNIDDE